MNTKNLACWALAAVPALAPLACSGNAETGDGGTLDGGLPENYVPIPGSTACNSDTSACLSGTFALKDFTGKATATKVSLFKLFPHGDAAPVTWSPVALDGTFAFNNVEAWDHYYIQAVARFGDGKTATSVATVVGPFAVPGKNEGIAIQVRPVYLEVLQQTASGKTVANWASAHLYDVSTGAELNAGKVSITLDNKRFAMPYGQNASGTKSFYVAFPAGTTGGTSFSITTDFTGLPSTTWHLVGDPATFSGKITAPTGTVPAGKPLKVEWTAANGAAYSQTELFEAKGAMYALKYVSPALNAPDVTSETIPGTELTTPGSYLLNESFQNPSCPASSDGCVYNVSGAAMNVTVK